MFAYGIMKIVLRSIRGKKEIRSDVHSIFVCNIYVAVLYFKGGKRRSGSALQTSLPLQSELLSRMNCFVIGLFKYITASAKCQALKARAGV